MIRAILTRWAGRLLSSAAQEQRLSDRERIKAKARIMREQLGLPESKALR